MITLGVCGGPRGTHEPGIALLQDTEIIFAAQEERFNRFKNSISCYPHQALKTMFKRLNIKPMDIDIVTHPGITYEDMKIRWNLYLEHNFGIKATQYIPVHHQMCHINAAYYASQFDNALIVTLDGVGDRTSGMVLKAISRDKRLEILKEFKEPLNSSVGFFWDLIT